MEPPTNSHSARGQHHQHGTVRGDSNNTLGVVLGLLSSVCQATAYCLTRKIGTACHSMQLVNLFAAMGLPILSAMIPALASATGEQLSGLAPLLRASSAPASPDSSWSIY